MNRALQFVVYLTLGVFVTTWITASELDAQTRPSALRLGATIMFVAPAGEVRRDDVARARKRLEAMGYVVRYQENIVRQRGYLAGTDAERAEELMAAFGDPSVDAVFCFTGGYGTTRMLDLLDYDIVAANPKILIGFSDITGLHLAFSAKVNMVTFHGPNVDTGFGKPENLNTFSQKYFWQNIIATDGVNGSTGGFTYATPKGQPLESLRDGTAQGRLTGGNLSLIAALMGTPYEIQTDGRVLFLEDVHEAPYRVDRMLSQLRLGGKLDRVAAVILGQFTEASDRPGKATLTMAEVFTDYFGKAPYPVLGNFPAGHHPYNATLPMGATVEVNATQKRVRVLQPPVARLTE